MKGLAWRSALDRPLSLAGSFVALALSVGLLGAMTLTIVSAVSGTRLQPHWFTRAAVVVAGDDTVSVTTGTGDDRETETVRTPAARVVPAALAARLASLVSAGSGTAAVTDYAGYGQAAGAPGQAIHPWAAAGLHPYRWVAGGPPDGPGQLVLTAPARYAPGQPVTVQTAAGPRRFTVSGVLATPAPPAFYATGAVARQLAGNRISAVALTPRAGQDAAALAREARSDARGLPVQVLTGDRRALAEPDPDGDLVAVASALLGSAAGVAGFVSMIVLWKLNANIWLSPLLVLGPQWYILFNVIAGARTMPKELMDAGDNFGVKGWLWWKRIALPAIFPHYLTGAITASGGAWNASVVAEVANWGPTTLRADGLGAYIAEAATSGDFRHVVLGMAVMAFFVVVVNRLFWQPLYWLAERKYRLS